MGKKQEVKITQITACHLPDCYKEPFMIFGLGTDNKVYVWLEGKAGWVLNKLK